MASNISLFYNELIELLTMLKPFFTSKTHLYIFTDLKSKINLLRQINYEFLLEKLIMTCHKYGISHESSYEEILRCIMTITAHYNFNDEKYIQEINHEFIEELISKINESIFQRKLIYSKLIDILKFVPVK